MLPLTDSLPPSSQHSTPSPMVAQCCSFHVRFYTWMPTPWDDVHGHTPPRVAPLNGLAVLVVVLWSV
ncbi:hypothetical protein BDZ89DRAFT_1145030 [Hymenopellis radicata]|nr:hypothetical protein BDZ89DRAFT_1145030 [Hymenopellis radicata]